MNPTNDNGWGTHRLIREGFNRNENGEWIKGKWCVILKHQDYVSTIHYQWLISENHNDINEALEWFEDMEAQETV